MNIRKGRHAPTFRNQKSSTSLREYPIFFPSEAMAEPDRKFSLYGSRPKNIFQTHLFLKFNIANEKQTYNVNQISIFINSSMNCNTRLRPKTETLCYIFFRSRFFSFPLNFNMSFAWSNPHTGIIFRIILYRKDFHAYFY